MDPALYHEYPCGMDKPLRIPTGSGLLLFMLVSGMPFVLSLSLIWPFSFVAPIGGLILSWVVGGRVGLAVGAVRGGVGGVFLAGMLCIFLSIGMLILSVLADFVGLIESPMIALAASAFLGPLLVGLYGRERSLVLLRRMRSGPPAAVFVPPENSAAPLDSPYPLPPEARRYWEGRSKRRRGGGERDAG